MPTKPIALAPGQTALLVVSVVLLTVMLGMVVWIRVDLTCLQDVVQRHIATASHARHVLEREHAAAIDAVTRGIRP